MMRRRSVVLLCVMMSAIGSGCAAENLGGDSEWRTIAPGVTERLTESGAVERKGEGEEAFSWLIQDFTQKIDLIKGEGEEPSAEVQAQIDMYARWIDDAKMRVAEIQDAAQEAAEGTFQPLRVDNNYATTPTCTVTAYAQIDPGSMYGSASSYCTSPAWLGAFVSVKSNSSGSNPGDQKYTTYNWTSASGSCSTSAEVSVYASAPNVYTTAWLGGCY